ncbi:MAG: thioredoxin family protein [Phycisphaerales bacterium]
MTSSPAFASRSFTPYLRTKRVLLAASAIAMSLVMLGMGTGNNAQASEPKATIGQPAPDFTLVDLDGKEHTLSEYTDAGKVVVLEWFSPMCPFVKKHYRSNTKTMLNLQSQFADQDLVWLRINSANASHPSAKLEANQAAAKKWGITTPILLDPTGQTGLAYGAKRTPEMYIVDASGTLVYHGAIDNRPDASRPGDENYVQEALSDLFDKKAISKATTKPYGCSIKY